MPPPGGRAAEAPPITDQPRTDPPPPGGPDAPQAATTDRSRFDSPQVGATGGDDEPPIESVPVRDALRVAQLDDEVLVVDGHPRYHLTGCPTLVGPLPFPLAVSVARRGGFTPCGICTPDGLLLARHRDRRAAPGTT